MKNLGFTEKIQALIPANISMSELGRIIAEHKERYILQTEDGTFNAEITGNMRYSAQSRADFPTVGDWVRMTKMDEKNAIVLELFPRFSVLERKAIGKQGEIQLIAANIDCAFIVQAVGHDFNLKRLERYLALCNAGNIKPVVLLSKTDLINDVELKDLQHQLSERIKDITCICLSSQTKEGYPELVDIMEAEKTYCFIGSSGVGKSTIVNCLLEDSVLKTSEISSSTNKGKHTTSHRELFVLPNKSIVVDTPGMREVGLTDNAEGIELTYADINELAKTCKFSDCSHTNEKGCTVIHAIENGDIQEEAFENYLKLQREQAHFASTIQEKRQKDRDLGKMYKTILNHKRSLK